MPERRKKLIEVALPLEAINRESAREKSIRHGHPSTLHLWWARRPLAACRAVVFAQLVDDPDSDPAYCNEDGQVDEGAGLKRAQLFNLIEELVKWENSNNDRVINAARAEIARCVASRLIEEGSLQKDTIIYAGDRRQETGDSTKARPTGKGRGNGDSDSGLLTPESLAEGESHPAGPLSGEFRTAWELIIYGHGDLEALDNRTKRLCPPEVVNHFLATYAPPVLDPFAGGGSIPLEAQRLGLRAHASDLNPVPVLINKALIEIPPKFAGMPPVNTGSDAQDKLKSATYRGAQGLAEDVRHYGQWMRDEAEKRIGHLYPKVKITKEMTTERPDLKPYEGQELTVIAWLWARTVPSSDPSMQGKHVPLTASFWLSKKRGKEAYVEPILDRAKGTYEFKVRVGKPSGAFDPSQGTVVRTGGKCLLSGAPMPFDHIREEGKAGRMKSRLMAIVCEGHRGRVYLDPLPEQEKIAQKVVAEDYPVTDLPKQALSFRVQLYGMDQHWKLFTPRQLTALTTFSDLVSEARQKVLADAQAAMSAGAARFGPAAARIGDPRRSPNGSGTSPSTAGDSPRALGTSPRSVGDGPAASGEPANEAENTAPAVGTSAAALGTAPADSGHSAEPSGTTPSAALTPSPEDYADAVATYLAFVLSKSANYWSSLCAWATPTQKMISTFGRQALPMVWDYAEANPFSGSTGNFESGVRLTSEMIEATPSGSSGRVNQVDATATAAYSSEIISTDPPYYDNIGYADLSDFFYVWLRRTLKDVYPQLLSTMLTPKNEEMIASPYRHDGSKAKAAAFFEEGLGSAIGQWRKHGCPDYPTTIFYAFKQAETTIAGTASTGWETFLTGVIDHGFTIAGTWPMRTELTGNLKKNVSALASSVVLACVPREANAPMATRREFLNALKRELPDAMKKLQSGNIAPVDLAQAAIGPGMAVFSRYSKVVESDGESMTVRTALTLINQVLDEVLAEQEGEFDGDTRWAVAWFEQHGVQEGPYGVAETLSKAKNTSVQGLVEAGVISARGGKVKLLGRDEMPDGWDPTTDSRATCWEATQHLIRRLQNDGEEAAADLLARLGGDYGERARDLAYRLYNICERKKWADEALAYNGLVIAWPELSRLAMQERRAAAVANAGLFESET